MSKRRGGSLPRVMPTPRLSGLDIRMIMPGLPIVAPDPLAVSLGGSETAGLQLAAELVRQGHRVTMACEAERPFSWRGVWVQQGFGANELAMPCDLLIVQRAPQGLRYRGAAKAAFLWLHDLPSVSGATALIENAALADRIVYASEFQAKQYRGCIPGLNTAPELITRNGIDLELIAEATAGVERDPFRIVYTTRPERGLEVLIRAVLPMILEQEPRASLHVTSYDYPGTGLEEYYAHLRALAEPFGDRIVWHPPLDKRALYRLMASGGVYLYPTPAPMMPHFAETSCITAMEAMACGLPWVSTDRGALSETVGEAGVLVPIDDAPHAGMPEIMERLAGEALRIMREPDHAERLRQAGLQRVQDLGWGPVARQIVDASRAVARPAPRPIRKGTKVMIATPCFGGMVTVPYMESLFRTLSRLEAMSVGVTIHAKGGASLITRARNEMAAAFLAHPDKTHMMWIDADIEWRENDIGKLLAHDLPMVCGLYPVKKPGGHVAACPLGPWTDAPRDPVTGCIEIKYAATGFLLIKREVFETLAAAYPESKITKTVDGGAWHLPWLHDFFPTPIVDGVMLSEDYGFCHRWRAIGGKVWADPTIQLTHHGMHGYAGDPMELFPPTPAA